MKLVPTIGAVATMIAVTAMSTPSFAAGRGPGPCTSSSSTAVGAEGPAMSGGQLMAGVGDCRHRHAWYGSYGYYQAPGYGYYDRGYGYEGPGVTIGVGPERW